MVVRKRDDSPPEVLPFENYNDAVQTFENMRLNWTETYFCLVFGGERQQEVKSFKNRLKRKEKSTFKA